MSSNHEKPKQKQANNSNSHKRQQSNVIQNQNQNQNQTQTKTKPLGNHTPNLPSKPQLTKPAVVSGWAAVAAAKSEPNLTKKPEPLRSPPIATTKSPTPPQTAARKNDSDNKSKASQQQRASEPGNEKEKEKDKDNQQHHHKAKNKNIKNSPTASTNPTASPSPSITASGQSAPITPKPTASSASLSLESASNSIPTIEGKLVVPNFNRDQIRSFLTKRAELLSGKAKVYKDSGSDWENTSSKGRKAVEKDKSDLQRLDIVAFELSKYLNNRSKIN